MPGNFQDILLSCCQALWPSSVLLKPMGSLPRDPCSAPEQGLSWLLQVQAAPALCLDRGILAGSRCGLRQGPGAEDPEEGRGGLPHCEREQPDREGRV